MSVTDIQPDEVFTVRMYKRYSGFTWANTYEVQAQQTFPSSFFALRNMVEALANLEAVIHLQGVILDRGVVSTYAPDSEPYNPDSFVTFSLGLTAGRPVVGEVLPLEMCLYVRRNVFNGRYGKAYYRGALTEQDVIAPSFRPELTDSANSNFQNAINNWLTSGGLGTGWRFVMARGAPAPTNVRELYALDVQRKIVIKQIGNRYFDVP